LKKFIFIAISLFAALTNAHAGGHVNEFTLANGIKVLHKEITDNPLVSAQLFLRAGSVNEKETEAGLANFVQVLLMQGTKNRDSEKLSRDIEDIGASVSTDVDNDFCTLGISVMDAKTDKAMELLADVAFNPAFPAEEIEKERTNVLAGIRSRQDHLHNVADDLFLKTFYGNHPYSWPDIGKKETVSGFMRADLERWHKNNYTGNGTVLSIAGNITLEKAKKLAEMFFSSVPPGAKQDEARPPAFPGHKQVNSKNSKFQQAYLMIGWPAPNNANKDFATLKVLNSLLGGRMSGRLFTELREKLGLAYEVNSFYPSRKLSSRFVVYMGLDKKNIPVAEKRIMEIIADIKQTPVSDKELEETKNYIRGIYLLDHQTIGRKAWYTGFWEIMGAGYSYDDQYLEKLMSVSSQSIQSAAAAYFTGDYIQVTVGQ